jgi:hypothetical protein
MPFVYVMVILAFVIDTIRCKETILQISKACVKEELLNCEMWMFRLSPVSIKILSESVKTETVWITDVNTQYLWNSYDKDFMETPYSKILIYAQKYNKTS